MSRPTPRSDRRQKHEPERRTYSAYLSIAVMDAVDALVASRRFPNRSEAIEEACRRLVLEESRASVAAEMERAA